MSDSTPPHRPRNYLSRREQWRILWLLLSLGLVVFMMNEARKPENWLWFKRLGDEAAVLPAAGPPVENPSDNRLLPKPIEEEIPGTFHSPGPRKVEVDASGRFFEGVEPALLHDVRDDTIFRHDEQQAWFHLFGVLQQTDEQTLQAESIGRVTYAQLFSQSNEYRGKLVTLIGTVRRASAPFASPKNDRGIERYCQLGVLLEDNPSTPMFVYCLGLPEGFPTGMEVEAEATITGFHFKRWAYPAGDGIRTTPVVLARTVQWRRPAEPVAKPVEVDARFFMIVVGVALGVSVLIFVYLFARPGSTPPPSRGEPPNLDAIRE